MGWGSGQSAHHVVEIGASFLGISAGQKAHGNGLHLPNRFGQGLKRCPEGAVKLLGTDHTNFFNWSDVASDDPISDQAQVVIHVAQARGSHFLPVGVAPGRDDIWALLKQLTPSLFDDALAALAQDLGHTQTALSAGYEGFDLVEFARAEVAGFGVRVDDRVGDDAHAVLPRNKRPPVGDRYPVNRWVIPKDPM